MAETVQCPECQGTGCDPEPLQAPADGALYLFPRCALCRGKGTVSPVRRRQHLKKKASSEPPETV